jgi:leucyl-tRNA synthetase
MIFINAVYKEEVFPKEYALGFIKLLSPITPHICEELWEYMGNNKTIAYEPWPTYDENKMVSDSFEMVVQVNGKVRGKEIVPSGISKEEMENIAKEIPNVKINIEGKEIVKIITIQGKIVNIVVK